jgi:hypothetical protein
MCYNHKFTRSFQKYTAIFAINSKGVIGWKLYEKGGIDTERLHKFLRKKVLVENKNKLIILDNASSHRNEKIKELINKENKILYGIPYQHFTNVIEQFFSILKSKLQKLDGLTYDEIKSNIKQIIKQIPENIYINIFNGSYKRDNIYVNQKKIIRKYKNYKE